MATIKDIAVKAGVSHGTVSNVLNKRGNVSAEKIYLVERAAEELGYKLNVQAQQLRSGSTKIVCVILPRLDIKRYHDFYSILEKELRHSGYQVQVFLTDDIEYQEEQIMKQIVSINPKCVIVVSSFIHDRNKIYSESTIPFLFVERKVKGIGKNENFISFDFKKIGQDLALEILKESGKKVAILCNNQDYSCNKEMIKSIFDELEPLSYEIDVYSTKKSMYLYQAFKILNSKKEYDIILTTNEEEMEYIHIAQQYHLKQKLPILYSIVSKNIGIKDQIRRYSLDYRKLGLKIAQCIAQEKNNLDLSLVGIENDGFSYQLPEERLPSEEKVLNILTIKNRTNTVLRWLIPDFYKKTGIRVNLVEVPYDELHKIIHMDMEYSLYDLIRVDMAWLPQIGKSIFRDLDPKEKDISLIKDKLIPDLSKDYYEIDHVMYAFPFDISVQMLFYQKDLFQDELVKREFFECYKRKLEIPKNFEEYNEVARFFTKKYRNSSPTQYGTCATYGSAMVTASDFLPRFREGKKSIWNKMGEVKIDTEDMKNALENYVEMCQYTNGESYSWWNETVMNFIEGNTAFHILFSNYASDMFCNSDSKVKGKIGVTQIPGESPLIGGGSIGIVNSSKRYEEAIQFLQWIYSDEVATLIAFLGGYICNKSLSENVELMEQYPWLKEMESSLKKGWRIEKNKKDEVIDELKFEILFGTMIRNVVLGLETIEEGLKKVQKQCEIEFNRKLI